MHSRQRVGRNKPSGTRASPALSRPGSLSRYLTPPASAEASGCSTSPSGPTLSPSEPQAAVPVIGVDIAEAMISLVRRLRPHHKFHRGNVKTPFSDQSFGAVVGNFVMLYLV